MKNLLAKHRTRQMKAEYDFSGCVRGKYAGKFRLGTNVVWIDPELTEGFPGSKSVKLNKPAAINVAQKGKNSIVARVQK
jgi:hypothetical protein